METVAQEGVHQEGENCGNTRDDTGEVKVHVLYVADNPQFLHLFAP